jgi:outer membrane biosynthesis protein TonB
MVKITIDRELVVISKKKKHKKSDLNDAAESAARAHDENGAATKTADETAAESQPEQSSSTGGVTTTNSPAHAAQVLRDALGSVFANGLDKSMIAAMPEFWKLYYQAVDSHADYLPSVPGVLRQSDVDQKAKLLTSIEPPSNEYAQNGGVAGMALYHAVIGADGKPEEIAVDRPIGFGLDENAVDVISKASFQPAIKEGKPVPVVLDLLVQFRIYSKRTAIESAEATGKPDGPVLPGPYTAHP